MRTRLTIDLSALARIRDAAMDGLGDAAEFLLEESQREVPFEEGTLAGSGTVTVDRARGEAAISYDTPYAVRQHEDQALQHPNGRKAKFLERPMREKGPAAFEHVEASVRRVMR